MVAEYLQKLNTKDAASGYEGAFSSSITFPRMKWGCTCHSDDHYYFIITGTNSFRMIHGKNLQDLSETDLHHYLLLKNPDGTLMGRDDVISKYLSKGYRVINLNGSYAYHDENQEWQDADNTYFLDISQLVQNNENKWVLKSHAFNSDPYLKNIYTNEYNNAEALMCTDRLDSSQEFLTELVDTIYNYSPQNKIAFVPFWGGVPENGKWDNAMVQYNEDGTSELININDEHDFIESDDNVTSTWLNLTSKTNKSTLLNQINDDFTYNGTNWTLAFKKAAEIINNMSSADKEKETLIIFLTDGLPQGSKGQIQDYTNPLCDASEEVKKIREIDESMPGSITIYTCGVCLGKYSIEGRNALNNIDTESSPFLLETISDFARLKTNLLNRINNNFYKAIQGRYACYKDVLSDNFNLDTSKLDSSWKVVDSESTLMTKGIPSNVYLSFLGNVNKVYVSGTKTIYWYINSLKNGSFEASGHSIKIPIKYNYYSTTTNGNNKTVDANTQQQLTYYPSNKPTYQMIKKINTPSLIFNRDPAPILNIRKTISGTTFDIDKTYRFVYSKTKYTSGKVTNIEGSASITIKSGESSGSTTLSNIPAGTYYVYEVNNNNEIIGNEIKTITINQTAQIETKAYSSTIPYSVRTSNNSDTTNRNNYLKISTTNGNALFSISFTEKSGTKIWKDNNNAYGTRPSTYNVELYQNNVYVKTVSFPSSGGWSFDLLEQYDANGNEYIYTIKEPEITLSNGDKYIPTIDGTKLINTLTGTTSLNGTKVWRDNSNALSLRPTSYTVKLYQNGTYQKATTFTNNQGWSFAGLAKYDANGKLYTYTISEDAITLSNGDRYVPTIEGTKLINTLTGTTSLSGTKTWKDNSNAYQTRPASYTVKLYQNGAYQKATTFTNNQGWSFAGLAKYDNNGKLYTYTITEDAITFSNGDRYVPSLDGTNLINTLTGTTSLNGTKVWKDNNNSYNTRPASYTVKLYQNGTYQKATTFTNNQGWSFTGLTKYDGNGKLYTYTISEDTITLSNGDTYKPTISGTTLTNTLTGTTSLSGTKVWKDNNNALSLRPVNYTVKLLRNGSELKSTSFANSKGWSFTGLAKYDINGKLYTYTISEDTITLSNGDTYKPSISGTTLTNTLTGITNLSGTKTWMDNNNSYNTRPSTYIVKLYQNGTYQNQKPFSSSSGWNFTGLAKYDVNGKLYNYTIQEDVITLSNGDKYVPTINGTRLINTLTGTTEIHGTKVWKDNSNAYQTRPASYTVKLYQNGTYQKATTFTNTQGWSFTGLTKYDGNGKLYTYTIGEDAISLSNGDTYKPSINGTVLTNTLTGNLDLTITKIWVDESNRYDTRPNTLDITLLQNNVSHKVLTLNKTNADKWTYNVTVDKYDSNGKKCTYTIEEDNLNINLLKYYYPVTNHDYDQENLTVTNYLVGTVLKDDLPQYKITVKKALVNKNNLLPTIRDFELMKLNSQETYQFPIILKEMERILYKGENSMLERYGSYTGKTFTGIVTNKGDLIFSKMLPGKYEISEKDIEYFKFVGINIVEGNNTDGASLIQENGKYYIVLSGVTKNDEQITVKVTNKLEDFRPYEDKKDKINLFNIIN